MKLYRVEVSFEYLCTAESESEARSMADEACRDLGSLSLQARASEARRFLGRIDLPNEWDDESLVYGDHGGDLSAREAFDLYVPEAADTSAQLELGKEG